MSGRHPTRRARVRALPPLLVTLVLALVLAACDSSGDGGGETAGTAPGGSGGELRSGLKLTFIPKQVNNAYFDVSDGGGERAIGEFGGTYKQVGPSESSAASQVSYITTAIQQQEDAIVISANDPNAIAPSLKEAIAAGIKVVTYDSDAAPDARNIFVNQADSAEIGRSQIRMISEQIGGSGKIAILSASANATNQNTWIQFMREELDKPEYANVELVDVVYGNDEPEESFRQAQGLLQAYPDLKGIISPTTVGIVAAARYLQGSDFKGQVKLTGLGFPNELRDYVKDGTVEEFALWNPADLGYLAAYAAAALASDQITGAPGETFTAGELGEYTIGQGGVVLLGPPTEFNAENIDQFDF